MQAGLLPLRLLRSACGASFSTTRRRCLPEGFLSQLERLGGRSDFITTNSSILDRHGDDESHHRSVPPDAVVFARCTEEVQAVVRLCGEAKVSIIPFGAGTSLEGHIRAEHGGISIDLSQMNELLRVDTEDMDCTVQAGITRLALNTQLRHSGLSFPVDPGADASIGGMVACGASGTAAVKYGTMRENTLGVMAVLASGKVVRTGGKARKSSAGYDLTRLLVGSEGTLAVITEATLRLHPLPAAISAATCVFPSLDAAARAVVSLLQCGVPIARSELLDACAIEAFNAYAKDMPDLELLPTLFLEFEGLSAAHVELLAAAAAECCSEHEGSAFNTTSSEAERRKLWAARHSLYYASLALRPGSRGIITDACVPLSQLAAVMSATAEDVRSLGVVAPIFGHAGDGNFHCILLTCPDDPPEYTERLERINDRLILRTLEVGGSCTGEHGVGIGKKKYLEREHGAQAVEVMRILKRSLDPQGILNPGKLVDV